MTSSPFVYIVIPNYHSDVHTIECLETVLKQQYQNFKVIVVDNSTGDTSLKNLLNWCNGSITEINTKFGQYVYPLIGKPIDRRIVKEEELAAYKWGSENLLFIKAKENNGFAAANNVALKFILTLADFDWVWLLNNDTVVPANCLQLFAEGQANLPENAGLVGTKLLYYDQQNVYQGIGGKYNKWLGTVKQVGEGVVDSGQFDKIIIENEVDYLIAASTFVSKGFLTSVGLMCEEYFFFFEELDWTLRGKKKGWRTAFLPLCKVYHKEGGSSTEKNVKSILVDVAAVRNRVLFTRKFYPWQLPSVAIALGGVVINRIKRKQFNRIPILLKAIFTNQSPKVFVKPR